eukprot:6210365-Pleurochrysis_carterae.AAC.1
MAPPASGGAAQEFSPPTSIPKAKTFGRGHGQTRDETGRTGDAGGRLAQGRRGCIGSTQPVAHRGGRGASPRQNRGEKPTHHQGGGAGGGCRQLPPLAPHPLSIKG